MWAEGASTAPEAVHCLQIGKIRVPSRESLFDIARNSDFDSQRNALEAPSQTPCLHRLHGPQTSVDYVINLSVLHKQMLFRVPLSARTHVNKHQQASLATSVQSRRRKRVKTIELCLIQPSVVT